MCLLFIILRVQFVCISVRALTFCTMMGCGLIKALPRLPQGSPGVDRNTFLSSPHLCFIIVFICDLFVSRDDPLMS